jgi:hypothetical protein
MEELKLTWESPKAVHPPAVAVFLLGYRNPHKVGKKEIIQRQGTPK